MGSVGETFDYKSLKELLKGTKATVLTPGDGQDYEDIIQRWSESCVKRAVCFSVVYSIFETQKPLSSSRHPFLRWTC